MSDDSISSSEPLCLAPDSCSSFLPPRKRLLAGFIKHTPPPSHESPANSSLDHSPTHQGSSLVENSLDHSSCCPDQAVDSSVPDVISRQRKSRRQCIVSRSYPKRTTKTDAIPSPSELDPLVKPPSVKDEATNVEVSEGLTVLSEDRADGGATTLMKSIENFEDDAGVEARGKIKQEKVLADEAVKMPNLREQDSSTSVSLGAGKPRRNPSRQNHNKGGRDLRKKQEAQIEKSTHIAPSLSDEELARQLHRAMNSSPRISRFLNCKDGLLLSLNR